MKNSETKKVEVIKLRIDGESMENGSIEYKMLVDVLEGTVGAIESIVRVSNHKNVITFNVQPPKEKCFEIGLQVIDWMGAATPLLPQAITTGKDVVAFFVEYLKIKKSLKGEEPKRENIQTNNNGDTVIKNNKGDVVYEDHRRIVNKNLIINVVDDVFVNKKIDKIARALEENTQADKLSFFNTEDTEGFTIQKNETDYFKYYEKVEQKPDSIVGHIREINNKTNNGIIVVEDEGKEKQIVFNVVIKDIKLLEKIVSNLAIAEANKTRVVFSGEKILDSKGKVKKIIVNDVDIPDKSFDF